MSLDRWIFMTLEIKAVLRKEYKNNSSKLLHNKEKGVILIVIYE